MEKPGNSRKQQEKLDAEGRKLPGQFVSDELEEQTARFVETAKTLAERRRKRESEDPPGPPPPARDQRSRRL